MSPMQESFPPLPLCEENCSVFTHSSKVWSCPPKKVLFFKSPLTSKFLEPMVIPLCNLLGFSLHFHSEAMTLFLMHLLHLAPGDASLDPQPALWRHLPPQCPSLLPPISHDPSCCRASGLSSWSSSLHSPPFTLSGASHPHPSL